MDEHSTCALQYGHLGKAIYVPERQSWNFSRTLAQPSLISYTGATRTAVESPLTAPQSSLVENKSLLPKVHPELAASWSLFGNETFSHAITTTNEVCDPQVSLLLDLGHAVDFENDDSGSRVVPIAAFASGECGNSISFRRLEEDTLELRSRTTSIRIPSIGKTDTAEWLAGGAPVRQICFARTVEEKATWMAARCPSSTTILRPLYHRDPVSTNIYSDGDLMFSRGAQNSRLDANPLIEISNLRTGGYAHADVTFNPWYQRQFAIVDQRGNWGIWDISGRHRRSKGNWSATCVRSGALPWLDIEDGIVLDNKPRHDGWATIEWAGDVNTLLVCDRRCPMLYRMEGDQVWPIPIELGLKRKSEWILDIKRSSSNASHAFILTTTRIFWLEITPNTDLDGGGPEHTLYPRLSWRHYRDPEDTTLRLSPLLTNEDFYLFLYSRLNHCVLGFQCPKISEEPMGDTMSVPDPFILDVPSTVDVPMESQISPNSAQFSTLVFREIAHSPTSVGKMHYDPKEKLVKLFLLDWRLAVRESVYTGPAVDSDAFGDEEQPLGREALRVKRRQHGVRKNRASHRWNDFIVDDWDESVSWMGTSAIPVSGISTVTPRAIPQWTTDYTAVYAVASGKILVKSSEGTAGHQSEEEIRQTIEALGNKLANATLSDQPASKTLLEILGSSPLLDDIDGNARAIGDITSLCEHHTADPENEYKLHTLPSNLAISPVIDFATAESDGKLKLVYIYDRLVNDWLSNLPLDIPGRTRITKEKVIRRIAADLILAQISISRKPDTENDIYSNQRIEHQDNAESSNPETSVESHRAGTPRRPSFSASEQGRDGSTFRNDFDFQPLKENKAPIYSSLSSLTTFKAQPSKSRNMDAMLSHWVPGMDPATYNWQRTVQSVEDDGYQRMSRSATPKHRSRKKTPQAVAMSSPAPPAISPAPPLTQEFGSQPTGAPLRRGILPSSQTAMEEDLPMTQVERGLFGGREANRKNAIKTRKKKRAAGF